MDFTKVKNFVDSLEGLGVPGADIAVYLKGKEVYRYQTGVADLETRVPISTSTLFPIYSITKVVTCVAALRLFEEGRFLLTDPLYDYMPEFKDMTVQYVNENGETVDKPATKPIRVMDLFTMSSGYSYEVPGTEEFMMKTKGNYTVRELASSLATKPLGFEPGTRWCYGFSHDILGALIEIISGKTIGEYFYDEIFAPLGMNDTAFKLPVEKHNRLVSGYTYDEHSKTHSRAISPLGYLNHKSPLYLSEAWVLEMPGAGLISSVDDFAKFANTLCRGGTSENGFRLLGEATVDLMNTNHLDEKMLADFPRDRAHNRGYGYGLGVRTMLRPELSGLNSTYGEYGWAGKAGTNFTVDPLLEMVYVYAYQLVPSKEEFVAPRFKNIIYGCL